MTDDPGLSLYVLGAIALLVLCSFLTRAGYFLIGDYLPLTDGVRRALRYAPTAALTGIIVPELLPWGEGVSAILDIKVWAAVIAVLAFWRTRSTVMVIVAGMLAYWVLKALV
ncbi:MAG TPA: AzlD domain-containing protein [Eoetvoesiella sp.]